MYPGAALNQELIQPTSLKPVLTPPQVRIPLLGGRPLRGIKKKARVSPGQPLAEPAGPGFGRPIASIPGSITEIDRFHITITHQDGASGRPPEPASFSGLSGAGLARRLTEMGLAVSPARPGPPRLVISAIDPEPGIVLAHILWRDQRAALIAGLELAQRLHPETGGQPVTLAPPQLAPQIDWGPVELVSPRYPAGLKPCLKQKALKIEDPRGEGVFTLRELYLLGRLARTGLPLVEVPLTLLGANYLVPVGTTAHYLLLLANHRLEPGEGVFWGGWFRGRALADLNRGLPPEADAMWVYRPEKAVPSGFCAGCRECRKACPARLKPDLIARQFKGGQRANWAELRKLRPDLCWECGLCSYHCPDGAFPSAAVKAAKYLTYNQRQP